MGQGEHSLSQFGEAVSWAGGAGGGMWSQPESLDQDGAHTLAQHCLKSHLPADPVSRTLCSG